MSDSRLQNQEARQLAEDAGRQLLDHQNPHLGSLIGAERSVFYLSILYSLLLFRRNHELEPLNEDIFAFARPALLAESDGSYDANTFNQDMRQLEQWELITKRIEQERLRGYKDSRRQKFRYRLAPQALAFMQWLEDQLREALEPQGADTRDLLEEVVANIRELQRMLNKVHNSDPDPEKARSAVYRLVRLAQLSLEINQSLADFNARLTAFSLERYDIATARAILRELEHFLEKYVKRIQALRREIVPELDKLSSPRLASRWALCRTLLEEEAKQASMLLRTRSMPDAKQETVRLTRFYEMGGQLDRLCARVRTSALHVMRKLTTHLRELERKSHRMEDLRDRIAEMAALPETAVPSGFMSQLIAPARMIADMHYWDAAEKAEPPQPRLEQHQVRQAPISYLKPKPKGDPAGIRSMNDEKLDRLRDWFHRTHSACPAPLSQGSYSDFGDHTALIEFARHGLLANGRELGKRNLRIETTPAETDVEIDERLLRFKELMVYKATKPEPS